jgi:hypothetical protein
MARKKISRDGGVHQGCKYSFCNECEFKQYTYSRLLPGGVTVERTFNKNTWGMGNLVTYTCPARFDPFDEACMKHDRFMELEAQKTGRIYHRPTQINGDTE